MKLTFLGANRQVTGSRYCLESAGKTVMIDCGLFQEREFLARNWTECPIPARSIDALLLTHAHIDHSGLIPRFVSEGYRGPIKTTKPTVELAQVMLRDSARIQVEDAKYKKRRHRREHRKGRYPEQPLYDEQDAERALKLFDGVDYGEPVAINDAMTAVFHDAGHILGSALLEIEVREGGQTRTVVFSGDLGQWDKPLVSDPSLLARADYVIMESTYGDREHAQNGDIGEQLGRIVNETVARGGNVVIPTFAVERAQELMFYLSRLAHADAIPDVPVFLDSPMAVDVTEVFRRFRDWFDTESQALLDAGEAPLHFPGLRMVQTVAESKAINEVSGPAIIMSTSGMCTAGRIKHHLRQNVERPESTILFVGYQGRGTLGRQILEKNPKVRIHGRLYDLKARVEKINGFSAHGDREDLLRWLGNFSPAPKQVFLTHGEADVAEQLATTVRERLGLSVVVPEYQEEVELAAP